MKINSKNNVLLGIGIVFFYFFASLFIQIPGSIIAEGPWWIQEIYLLIYQIVEFGIIILLLYPTLENNVKDLKLHHKEYFQKYFKYWFLLLGLMMISNLIIAIITPNTIASNEQSIREMLGEAPIYTFIVSVFIAPFLEEFIFRQGIRNIISNNLCFILVSGILFGSMHVITSFTTYSELLYIIPYSIPGIVFAYLLTKTNNVLVPASIHFIHNGFLMSLQIFMLLLGAV